MKDTEKINMEINIGGERFRVNVPFDSQDLTRDVEAEANRLLENWRRTFPKRTDKGLLAMMVYQYASYYKNLTEKYEEATAKAEAMLASLSPQPDKE